MWLWPHRKEFEKKGAVPSRLNQPIPTQHIDIDRSLAELCCGAVRKPAFNADRHIWFAIRVMPHLRGAECP